MSGTQRISPPNRSGERLLADLADADRKALEHVRIAVVVAHADDEAVGCGGQLRRLSGASIGLVTDGAPRNLADANRCGFATSCAYARARADEFRRAMKIANVPEASTTMLGLPDQQAARHLTWCTRRLVEFFAANEIEVAVTHAFEGGHPDHDATAFAVHAARSQLEKRGHVLDIIEMPLYRLSEHGVVRQSLAPPRLANDLELALPPDVQRQKQRLIETYTTQQRTLAPFAIDHESLRIAPNHDFTVLPNGGRVLYESFDWGLSGSEWCALARKSLQELEQGGSP
jgi:LmbE family N-acetylglucosaminyl deacetylase